MPGEKVVLPCHHSVVSANIPAKEFQNRLTSFLLTTQKTGHLMKSLTLVVGMIDYDSNTMFNERCFWCGCRMEGTNRPSIIWVSFDDLQIGERYTTQASMKNGHLYLMYNEHL